MAHEPQNQSSDDGKNPLFCSLATLCAFPFVILSGFAVAAILTKRPDLLKPLVFSAFFLPILLLVAVGGLVFIVLAWMKSPRRNRTLLVFYFVAIVTYWVVLKASGPW
jgi:hypothetical protein